MSTLDAATCGRRRTVSMIVAASCILALPSAARALWDDQLELFVEQVLARDDNVFRLADAVDPTEILGTSSTGDTYLATTAGFSLDLPVSAQRFVADGRLSRYRFDRFSELDLDGHDGQAEWRWQVGKRLRGQLGYTTSRALSAFSNVQQDDQRGRANFRSVTGTHFRATHSLLPRWQVSAGASRSKHVNSAEEFSESDIDTDAIEISAAYVTPMESRLGVIYRAVDGAMPNPQVLGTFAVDNSYRQQSLVALLEWPMTRFVRLRATAGTAQRNHEQLNERDFDGWIARAELEWQPLDTLTMNAAAERAISSVEGVYVGYALVEGIEFGAKFSLTDRANVSLRLSSRQLDHLGDPATVLAAAPQRTERVNRARLAVSQDLWQVITLELAWQRESRSSSVAFADYSANTAELGVRVAF